MFVKKNECFHTIPNKNLVIIWTPRAACTNVITMYFQEIGLLDKIKSLYYKQKNQISLPVHWYYGQHKKNMLKFEKNIFSNVNTKYIQFTVNPYRRVVSSYIFMMKYGHGYKKPITDLTFEEFITKIINKKIGDNGHHSSQIFFKNKKIEYFKMEKIKNNIDILNKKYSLNFKIPIKKTKHLTKKTKYDIKKFVGNIKYSKIKNNIPYNYSYFYNDLIRKNVEKIYGEDIEKLNYTWQDFINTKIE